MHHCSMCPVFTYTKTELIRHLIYRHRNAPNFLVHCSAKGCGSSFRNINTFRKHCERKHALETIVSDMQQCEDDNYDMNIANDEWNEEDDENVNSSTDFARKVQDAQYILKLKAGSNLSQCAIQEILLSTSTLIEQRLNDVKSKLVRRLPADIAENLDIDSMFQDSTFQDLEGEYQQEKLFADHLGYIKPGVVKLGEENKLKKTKGEYKMMLCEVNAYIVPFQQQLSQLLSMPEVGYCLTHLKKDSFFEVSDFQDGTYMLHNHYFQCHPNALLFGLYSDDVEIANPIGSHKKKHKLTVFYWILLNIHPEFRYKLQSCQLLGTAKTSHVKKFGIEKILSDFNSGMQQLHSGLNLTVNGVTKLFNGTLLCVFGDTPAARFLGGFKEGVGFAEKPCRTCEINHTELERSLAGEIFPTRSESEHRDRCDSLCDETLTIGSRKYWSKKYGIVKPSVLLKIPEFSVTKCILHDPMHVLLEGVCKMEIQLMLKHFIEKKSYFSLKVLNQAIQNFPYSCEENLDKPQLLEKKSLETKNTLPMTAIETLHFMQLLPFLIGERVSQGDDHWMNFLRLLQITQLVLSPTVCDLTIACLRQLIATHDMCFKTLFPESSCIPKLHYLTHFPEQIKLFGPGRNHWCMRFEAKHALIKNKKWRNFKNLPFSVARYHQRLMCLHQMGSFEKRSDTFLYEGDKVSEGRSVALRSLSHKIQEKLLQVEPDVGDHVLACKTVVVRNIAYRAGCVLLLEYSEDAEPQFAVTEQIYVANNATFLVCNDLKIVDFNSHLNAFECLSSNQKNCIQTCELKYKWPQIVHVIGRKMLVMLKNVDFAWSL